MQYPTLNHEYDNSLVSNNFGFLRCPLVFEPESSNADVVVTGVPFDMATSGAVQCSSTGKAAAILGIFDSRIA